MSRNLRFTIKQRMRRSERGKHPLMIPEGSRRRRRKGREYRSPQRHENRHHEQKSHDVPSHGWK
jgi:hypothetical protein